VALPTGLLVFLRHSVPGDAAEFLNLVRVSRRLHRPWVFPPSDEKAFASYVKHAASDRFLGLLVCLKESAEIVGVINLSEIVLGNFQSAYLGFYGHAEHSGRGYMKEGIHLLLRHAFRTLGLHRVEANVQPGNTRSLALLQTLSFKKEGYSPKYLKIGGRWRDHERWAMLAEDWRVGGSVVSVSDVPTNRTASSTGS
jgi:ribosomal-protein-alanine N-acetyltransferase